MTAKGDETGARLPTSLAAAAALAAGTFALFFQVRGHAFLRFDDPAYVTRNPWVLGGLSWAGVKWAFTTFHASNWHPLTWLSLMLDVQLFGVDPGASLLVNAGLHAINAALLFLALARLTRAPGASLLVAALFAVHPLHVESVAWVSERKDVLSTAFGFAAIWAYARHVEQPRRGSLFAVAVPFALSLLAKPMLVTLPFVLLLLDVWPLGRIVPGGATPAPPGLSRSAVLAEKIPLLALSAASSVVTWIAQWSSQAIAPLSGTGAWGRAGNAAVGYVRYLGNVVWPASLAAFYPLPPDGYSGWSVAGALAVLAAISAVAAATLRGAPWIAVGWCWFLGTLVPVIGLVQVGSQAIADRYMYVPLVGLLLGATWTVRRALVGRSEVAHAATTAGALALVGVLAALTWRQLGTWRDHETLFLHALEVTGPNAAAHASLAALYGEAGDAQRALHHASEAARIAPDDHLALVNLSAALRQVGRRDEALEAARRATRIAPRDAEAWLGLSATARELGQHAEARAAIERSLALEASDPRAWTERAAVALASGDPGSAVEALRQSTRLEPDDPRGWFNLGYALGAAGRRLEAIDAYARALELRPGYAAALQNLAITCGAAGVQADGVDACRRVSAAGGGRR